MRGIGEDKKLNLLCIAEERGLSVEHTESGSIRILRYTPKMKKWRGITICADGILLANFDNMSPAQCGALTYKHAKDFIGRI